MKRCMNIIGSRVRQSRAKFKPPLTQQELSARILKQDVQIDRAGVAKIETGIRCVLDYEVVALAKALEVSVGWLLSGRRR
jgi:HTH-type transcriptional regulator, cell division transcriptional repressor